MVSMEYVARTELNSVDEGELRENWIFRDPRDFRAAEDAFKDLNSITEVMANRDYKNMYLVSGVLFLLLFF